MRASVPAMPCTVIPTMIAQGEERVDEAGIYGARSVATHNRTLRGAKVL